MKWLHGITHWMRKHAKGLSTLIIIVILIFGYARFRTGEIRINDELITDKNLDAIASNWRALLDDGICICAPVTNVNEESGARVLISSELMNSKHFEMLSADYVLTIMLIDDGLFENIDELGIEVNDSTSACVRYARYNRAGILSAFGNTWPFGYCGSTFVVDNYRCYIRMDEFNASGKGETFNRLLSYIIDVVTREDPLPTEALRRYERAFSPSFV